MVVTRRCFAERVAYHVASALGWPSSWDQRRLADEVLLAVRAEEARCGPLVLVADEPA